MHKTLLATCTALLLAGCAGMAKKPAAPAAESPAARSKAAPFSFTEDPYPSTYRPLPSTPLLLTGATVLVGDGSRLEGADVLMESGKIAAIGVNLSVPAEVQRVDARGKWITPGLIDVHSHLGVYPSPAASAHSDGNEMTAPVTAQVWAEHSIWPQDPGFATALAGGVTSLHILPGSANLIGGRGVTLRNVPATTYQAMKFPGAPWGLKMACGENPKRVYGSRGGPATRMGNIAGFRAAFAEAQDYRKKQTGTSPGPRNYKLDSLVAAMDGDILIHNHCYRADEMAIMLDLAREFGFRITAFHHGVEAYKIADRLAAEGVCGALWADWWGFKMESFDGIQENLLLVDRVPGSCAIVHSDSGEGIQRLNQEAAKIMANGRRIGIETAPEHAIRWLTQNAARALGIEAQTGTLHVGKRADVVLWNGNPFSSYALAEQVYIDGARLYDRQDAGRQPQSDFLLGQDLMQGETR